MSGAGSEKEAPLGHESFKPGDSCPHPSLLVSLVPPLLSYHSGAKPSSSWVAAWTASWMVTVVAPEEKNARRCLWVSSVPILGRLVPVQAVTTEKTQAVVTACMMPRALRLLAIHENALISFKIRRKI